MKVIEQLLNNQSYEILDEELGWVVYPCTNAVLEGLEKSMA